MIVNLKAQLSKRIGIDDIHTIISEVQCDDEKKEMLYALLFDSDDDVAYQAAWVMTHYSSMENKWLCQKQDELINAAMACEHAGKGRLILTLLYNQPMMNPLRVDFLNFCFDCFLSPKEPIAVRSLGMKLAYELCRLEPELLPELRVSLETMETAFSPAIDSSRKKILKAIEKGKSLQVF